MSALGSSTLHLYALIYRHHVVVEVRHDDHRVGRTIASMIASESIRPALSAARSAAVGQGYSSPNQKMEPLRVRCRKHADLIEADRWRNRAKSRGLFALLELRNHRDGDTWRRQRSYLGCVADPAGIDRHIIQTAGVCRARRNTTDGYIARSRGACGPRGLRK